MQNESDPTNYFASQHRHWRQCTKEAWIAVVCWFVGLLYCTTAFVTMGYLPVDQRPAEPPTVWGIPAWVFWGLFLPWGAQIVVTWWFAICVLRDDEPHRDFPNGPQDG